MKELTLTFEECVKDRIDENDIVNVSETEGFIRKKLIDAGFDISRNVSRLFLEEEQVIIFNQEEL